MEQLQQIKQWLEALTGKEKWMVSGTATLAITTLFFLAVWEPLHLELNNELQKQGNQNKHMAWMQQAAKEVKSLRGSGSRTSARDKNEPTTLIVEQSIKNAGLKSSTGKIESSGNNGARVTLKDASFNQILIWLSTLASHHAINVSSANINLSSEGRVDARLTFERL